MESYAAQYRVKFHWKINGDASPVNGDDKQLKQLLLKWDRIDARRWRHSYPCIRKNGRI